MQFRFSMRQMLGIFTILAVLIPTLVGIENWRRAENHEIEVTTYRLNREVIEARRDKLSKAYYDNATRELDQEAARLGVDQ